MSKRTNTLNPQALPLGRRMRDWMFDNLGKPLLRSYFKVLNHLCRAAAGGNKRPVFYDVKTVYPSLQILEDNVEVIKAEFQKILLKKSTLPRYHELDDIQTDISETTQNDWKVFMLQVCGENADIRDQCPLTRSLLEQIPYVNQAFFSILDARKSVPAHDGPYCGYLRYHLGIEIPKDNSPHIRILNERHVWQQDKGVLFDDSWNHEVINNCDEIRVVLLVDVLRPLPGWLHKLNVGWTRYVGKHYSRRLLGRLASNDYTI
ncbi:aspartate beta-hydroxylase/beta-hydroxylase [Idiomarina loihiensis]|uniref:aspartyl/asparaginyl beta-hydroxylase domain-containing protein n=1 Tax=Idiomarina TaxID=135575 RepID=UPI000D71C4E9|nr:MULTISPECIES: aspartyl/asparaginyl beta-hydroxylase domain-containing protein [Idiomarina]PWW40318.1 aspartate beta-hydroxylase/beta-hydroxylase [Idiomarina loihiensis]TDP50009.1 aspartate beta-hydroxylase/beta-hydroxylase [Idiomarina loihiensis]TDS24639.1 aspartate beta-hydroxylase/beta-hydroxylase [Idiomarina sp. H2]